MLSMHDENLYAERALRSGAMGYVMKSAPQETVMAAIRKVAGGEIFLSDAISGSCCGHSDAPAPALKLRLLIGSVTASSKYSR